MKEDNSLQNRPLIAILIVLILDIILVSGVGLVQNLIMLDDITGFLVKFVTRALIWLIVVPIILGLPNGRLGIVQNIQKMGIFETEPKKKIGILSIIGVVTGCVSLWLPAILFSNWYVDISTLWPSILLAINPGLWEEVVYRGIILTILLKRFSDNQAIALGSLIFSLMHLQNLLFGQPPVAMMGQLIFAFMGALLLATLYIRSGSLVPGILAHYFGDALYLFLTFSLVQPGPNLITGGLMMILSWSIASVIMAIIVLRYFPRLDREV